MEILTYTDEYKQQVIDLILYIQNEESKIGLSIEERPDLLDVKAHYFRTGGNFLIAVCENKVVGTLAYMNYGNGNAVLKKIFRQSGLAGQESGACPL